MSTSAPEIPMTNMATDAYAYLEPIAGEDPSNGWVLMILCGALGAGFAQAEAVCRAQPGRQPYQQVYDIARCPDDAVPGLLGWLGQFVGVAWTPYTDSGVKRTQVQAETQFYRGSPGNTLAAATAAQTEPNRTTIIERYDGDAWQIAFAYDPAYTPDVGQYEMNMEAAIPWAIKPTFTSTSIPLFDEGTLTPDSLPSSVLFDTATLSQIT